jgi:nucleoside-diphosphate-sugar epimerase
MSSGVTMSRGRYGVPDLEILIIGGTRNLGHLLALELLAAGHRVTVFNRGQTPDELPAEVQRLHGDRGNPAQLGRALGRGSYDAVVDTSLYNGVDAQVVTELLCGRVGHYVFLSTGQVYLVRGGLQRPFAEEAYEGPVMPAPVAASRDYEDRRYGVEKRQAEDVLAMAWQERQFPATTLRLPMVNSERDHFFRIYGYLLRLWDGGPILLPAGPHLHLRHVYGEDVVRAIVRLLQGGLGKGRAYNLSQEESLAVDDFLSQLASLSGCGLHLAWVDRDLLDQHQLLPDCSPFSDPWMSELDNQRSKGELGVQYTPLPVYLERLVGYYKAHRPPLPQGYQRRGEEIRLAMEHRV